MHIHDDTPHSPFVVIVCTLCIAAPDSLSLMIISCGNCPVVVKKVLSLPSSTTSGGCRASNEVATTTVAPFAALASSIRTVQISLLAKVSTQKREPLFRKDEKWFAFTAAHKKGVYNDTQQAQ
jgi:hypothetical protein